MYSQNAEERYILAACPEPVGRFLDIGAWNATCMSNTRALFERGWGGLLLEPSPGPFASIQKEYAPFADRITVLNVACSLEPNPLQMWISEDAVSTSTQSVWDRWHKYASYKPEQVEVPTLILEDVYATYGPFDFVNIDTEGTSVDLCLRLLTLGHRPKCICVEHDERMVELLGSASEAGYVCSYASGENAILVRQ